MSSGTRDEGKRGKYYLKIEISQKRKLPLI